MRIIGGEFRGRRLRTLPGAATRPTADKVRGAVFNSLFDVREARVLDVFGGSGAMALEAVSRGAQRALIFERDAHAFDIIRENVAYLNVTQAVELRRGDALELLGQVRESFDLIILDPPYGQGLLTQAIDRIETARLLAPGGTLVAETGGQTPEKPEPAGLIPVKEKRYGNTIVMFYKLINEV